MPVFARPENYLLELGRDEPILLVTDLHFMKGDLLLISTDRRYIPAKKEPFRDIVVILDKVSKEIASLARVEFVPGRKEGGPEHIEADMFQLDVIADKQKRGEIRPIKGTKGLGYERLIHSKGTKKFAPMSHLELEPAMREIEHDDIVGVCRAMIRTKF